MMKPTIAKLHKNVNATFLTMPGVHSEAVKGHKFLVAESVLVQDLYEKFLIEHGTNLKSNLQLNDDERLENYSKLVETRSQYKKQAGLSVGPMGLWGLSVYNRDEKFSTRVLPKGKTHFFSENYFINIEHANLFNRIFPTLFKYFFINRMHQFMSDPKFFINLELEFKKLKKRYFITARSLKEISKSIHLSNAEWSRL